MLFDNAYFINGTAYAGKSTMVKLLAERHSGFYPYPSKEIFWAYWARYIYVNRYLDTPKPTYEQLLSLVKGKDYFVTQKSSFCPRCRGPSPRAPSPAETGAPPPRARWRAAAAPAADTDTWNGSRAFASFSFSRYEKHEPLRPEIYRKKRPKPVKIP